VVVEMNILDKEFAREVLFCLILATLGFGMILQSRLWRKLGRRNYSIFSLVPFLKSFQFAESYWFVIVVGVLFLLLFAMKALGS
jgi:hypothetical protein